MAIDKAVRALVTGKPRVAAHELGDFVHETVTKGVRPPNTHGAPLKSLKALDVFVHGAAAVTAIIPFAGLLGDGVAAIYGVVKYALGKGFEKVVGKGGLASDVKASGRLSMSAAGVSLVAGAARLVPGPGTVAASAVSATAHASASLLSAHYLVQQSPRQPPGNANES